MTGVPSTYAVVTFGCRVNQADSLAIEAKCQGAGAVAAPVESADLVVINSCSVTATADQGTRQMVRRVARLNPSAQIVVTGCYASRAPEDVVALAPGVTVVPNPRKREPLLEGSRLRVLSTSDLGEGDRPGVIAPGLGGRTAYTVRIQTGCNEPCSYCIIPTTRGTPASQPGASVLAELARAWDAGYEEVVIAGVHLGAWGRDLDGRPPLVSLLEDIEASALAHNAAEPPRVRISSLEPMDCTPALIRLLARSRVFAPHLHLPLQHASDRVLAAMRRPYRRAQFQALVDAVREALPHAAIGTDLITGFPGERDDDAAMLEAYVETSPLTHLHVFPYSDRPDTPASRLGHRVPGGEVRARSQRLRDIGAQLQRRFLSSQVGTVHRALTVDDGSLAVTGNYLKVRIPPGLPRNVWTRVRITAVTPNVTGRLEP